MAGNNSSVSGHTTNGKGKSVLLARGMGYVVSSGPQSLEASSRGVKNPKKRGRSQLQSRPEEDREDIHAEEIPKMDEAPNRGNDYEITDPDDDSLEIIDREADSVVIPKQPLFSSGSRNLEGKRKPRASGRTSASRDDGKPKKRVKSQVKAMPGVPIEDDSDNCEEVLKIRKISEIEFRRTKEPNELKIGSSTGKEVSEDNNRGLVSPKLASHDPDQGSPDKSSSFLQKGNNDDDMNLERYFREVSEADETEIQNRGNRGFSKQGDLFRKLADSVLEREPVLGNNQSNGLPKQTPWDPNQSSLPKKFRFEDEVPKQVEKTDSEIELEEMFALHNFCMAFGDQDPFDHSKVPQKHENSPVGETEDPPCVYGKHEFEKREDTGVRCRKCLHVAVDPKDIIPDWAEKPHQALNRETSSRKEEDPLRFDCFHPTSSKNKCVAFNSENGTVWNIKPGVRESMYKHQQEGFEFLWMNLAGSINLADLKSSIVPTTTDVGGCIISHAPGTGKTRLTIVFIETYLKVFPKCRPMIVAPASMLLTWEEEFKKWDVDFPFHNLNKLELLAKENKISLGPGSKRRNNDDTRMIKIYEWNQGGSILGISYSLFENLTGEKYIKKEKKNKQSTLSIDRKIQDLRKILLEKPGLVVMDEGHTPRNQSSNIWNVLLKLRTWKRVILSGTPFQNSFAELFNTLRLVRPAIADVLGQDKVFSGMISSKGKSKSVTKNSQSDSTSKSMNSAVERLKAAMSPFVHVHKGTILQESLPGLRDTVVLLKPAPMQKILIEALEKSKSKSESEHTFKFEHDAALISMHPYLLGYCDPLDHGLKRDHLRALEASKLNPNAGAKAKFVLELVRLSVIRKEKVLIFSQYIAPLELIQEQMCEIFSWVKGKQILQIHGKLDQKQRQILINAFNDPHNEAKVMLGSTKCCSEGISLVGASRVVLLDVVWNPSVEHQAISRAYRMGQKKFVHTYHLMTSGTSEADKYCRQVEKERLSELVFCSSSNESQKRRAAVTEDRILEAMVSHVKLKDMFERIIYQPKETDLIQTFGLN